MIFDLINPTFNLSNGVFGMLPFIDKQSQDIICITKQNISISKQDWDAHETSWDFTQNELIGITPKVMPNHLGGLRIFLQCHHRYVTTEFRKFKISSEYI